MGFYKKDSTQSKFNRVVEKVLLGEYNQKLTGRFRWDQDILSRFKSAYREEHGRISSDIDTKIITDTDMEIINAMMNKEHWRSERLKSARAKSSIGIVQEQVGSAKLGAINNYGTRTATFTANQNAQKGHGVQMSIDLPLDDLGLMTSFLLKVQNNENPGPDVLPPHLRKFCLKGSAVDVRRAAISKQFEAVQTWLLDASGNNMNMTAKQVLQPKHVTDQQIEGLVKKANFKGCKDPDLARQQEINLRKFVVGSVKEIMLGEVDLLGEGTVVLLPIVVNLPDGKVLTFPAVATMGFKNESGDVVLNRTTCPGMSNNHHGSQSNNNHPIILDGNTIFIPSIGWNFDTNASKDATSKIKLAEDRESGEYATSLVSVNGIDRLFRKVYPCRDEERESFRGYNVHLTIVKRSMQPGHHSKKVKSEKIAYKTTSHHRLNNLVTSHIGTHGKDKELNNFLKKENASCLEALYIRTGESQIDYDDMLVRYGLTEEEVESWYENVEREKVPQGQCDNDHCCHRNHPICNSHYAALPMSHSANTINSITRRMCGDWCYGMSTHHYIDGR